jgi:hypothetical protein
MPNVSTASANDAMILLAMLSSSKVIGL